MPKQPKDVSFDRGATLMRTVVTEGHGVTVREGSECVVHFTIHVPAEVRADRAAHTSRPSCRALHRCPPAC